MKHISVKLKLNYDHRLKTGGSIWKDTLNLQRFQSPNCYLWWKFSSWLRLALFAWHPSPRRDRMQPSTWFIPGICFMIHCWSKSRWKCSSTDIEVRQGWRNNGYLSNRDRYYSQKLFFDLFRKLPGSTWHFILPRARKGLIHWDKRLFFLKGQRSGP